MSRSGDRDHQRASRAGRLRSRLYAHPAALVLLLAAGVRLALFSPELSPKPGGDQARFLYQADHLLAGDGFLWRGAPCTTLPPGYPAFVALVFGVQRSTALVLAVQFVLSVAACGLLYLAVRPRGAGLAMVAALALAIHLWSASYCWKLMSESLGVFLTAALVYLLTRLETDSAPATRAGLAAALGAIAAGMVLTSPATLVLSYAAVGVLLWRNRRQPVTAGSLLAGFALIMAPWQVHCYRELGRVVPTGIHSELHESRHFVQWQRSWLLRTQAPHAGAWGYFLWDTPGSTIDQVPRRAFQSDEEREQLDQLARAWRAADTPQRDRDAYFEPLATERIARSRLRYFVGLPLLRSALLWLEMPQVSHAQMNDVGRRLAGYSEHSGPRARQPATWQRAAKAAFSNLAFALHVALLALGLVFMAGAVVSRRPLALAIVGGVLAYTAISSYFAMSEFRRNLPFVPAILYLAYFLPERWIARGDGLVTRCRVLTKR